jgi:hypothetical protein
MKVRAGGRTGAWIAWATLTVYWGCVAAGFLLRVRNDPDFAVWDQLFERVIGGAFPTVGAVIVAHQPRNRIGWLCCTVGLLVGPAFFAQDYAWYALVHRPGSLPGGLAMAWLSQWPLLVAFALMVTFLLLLFPDGRLVSPRWRIVAWAAAAVLAGLWIGIAFAPGPLGAGGLETVSNPLGIQWPGPPPRLLAAIVAKAFELLIHLSALLILLSAASMVVRFRRARGVERQQLKWFTYAPLAAVLVWLVSSIPALMSEAPTVVVLLRVYVAGAIISVGIPLAIGIAVLRYRLYDIDRLINRTLVYGWLTAILGLVYAAAVLVLGQVFGGVGGDPPSWAVAGATLAVAALFQPARRRIQAAVDRRFNRRKYDTAKTIQAYSTRLRDQVDLDTLSTELLAVVDQTMEPTRASLWLRPPPPGSPSTAPRAPRPTPWAY